MSIIALWRLNGARYRLETVRCAQCSAFHFPPRMVCPDLPARTHQCSKPLHNRCAASTPVQESELTVWVTSNSAR